MSERREAHALRVLRLLSDGNWHSNIDITMPYVGGNRGVGRLWELRRAWGIDVDKVRMGEDQWAYRWVDYGRFAEIVAAWGKKVQPRQLELV